MGALIELRHKEYMPGPKDPGFREYFSPFLLTRSRSAHNFGDNDVQRIEERAGGVPLPAVLVRKEYVFLPFVGIADGPAHRCVGVGIVFGAAGELEGHIFEDFVHKERFRAEEQAFILLYRARDVIAAGLHVQPFAAGSQDDEGQYDEISFHRLRIPR